MREFNRGAAHNEMGMQPVETTGDGVDGDGDGVANEFTDWRHHRAERLPRGPAPPDHQDRARVASDVIDPLPADETAANSGGSQVFGSDRLRHLPRTARSAERSDLPRAQRGSPPIATRRSPPARIRSRAAWTLDHPVAFDLTRDQPDNQVEGFGAATWSPLGSLAKNSAGNAPSPSCSAT